MDRKRMTIMVVAGRRIDAPATPQPQRFPLKAATKVRQLIRAKLVAVNASGLIASGACGAGLMARDVTRELGMAKRRLILPFDRAEYPSVTDRPGGDLCDWGRFNERSALGGVMVLNEAPGADAACAAVNMAVLAGAGRLADGTVSRRVMLVDRI
jgi:hypothetical protein